jgi:hypothetical protein
LHAPERTLRYRVTWCGFAQFGERHRVRRQLPVHHWRAEGGVTQLDKPVGVDRHLVVEVRAT